MNAPIDMTVANDALKRHWEGRLAQLHELADEDRHGVISQAFSAAGKGGMNLDVRASNPHIGEIETVFRGRRINVVRNRPG